MAKKRRKLRFSHRMGVLKDGGVREKVTKKKRKPRFSHRMGVLKVGGVKEKVTKTRRKLCFSHRKGEMKDGGIWKRVTKTRRKLCFSHRKAEMKDGRIWKRVTKTRRKLCFSHRKAEMKDDRIWKSVTKRGKTSDLVKNIEKGEKQMREILRLMKERETKLKKAIAKAELEEGSFPEGHLRISVSNNRIRYYKMLQNGDTKGEYIVKEKCREAKALAQKDYNRRFLKTAKAELGRLERDILYFSGENTDLLFQNLSENRRKLITPYILTDEQYALEWLVKDFKPNPYMAEKRIYDTNRGEMVRSKSEAILADMLYDIGIPYHYEKPLRLKSGRVVYPDFTLLEVNARKEIYFEHFGLLEDEEYLGNALAKLDEYRGCGIYPGKNLIFTYETRNSPLDIKGIKKMLMELLGVSFKSIQ